MRYFLFALIVIIYVELYKAMLKSHTHIGCNVSEIQNQKDEHQAFQDTAKVSDSMIYRMNKLLEECFARIFS